MTKGSVTSCPDAEVLAAWVDRGLDERERAEVTAHVANCDDCRAVVANVLKFQDASDESNPSETVENGRADEPDAGHGPPPRRMFGQRKIVWAGGILAAAAALVLAVDLQSGMLERWRAERRLADLVQATGEQRTVEARLTGGFAYGPLRAPVRSGGSSAARDNWSLLAAAGRIREEAQKNPVAANLHSLGVAALVLGEHDEAIRALEDATAEEPGSGRYQSDLAAAYLARAQAAERPDDLTRGLTAAERALKADHTLLEARFNRALALERLYLTEQARAAWNEYLEYDPGSSWASEARQHLQALPDVPAQEDQAKNNSPPGVSVNTVEAALDWLLRQGLPALADAALTQPPESAHTLRSQLLDYAASIAHDSGDAFAADIIPPDTIAPAAAEALRQFGGALIDIDASRVEPAEQTLDGACGRLREPLRSLCLVELGMLRALRPDAAGVDEAASRALAVARAHDYAYLAGRALRLQGYRDLMTGQTGPALEPYRDAFVEFERGHYATHMGLVATQVADLLDYSGLSNDAWRWRYLGLRIAATTHSPRYRYLARVSAAELFAARRQHEVSRAFAEAIGMLGPDALPPIRRAPRELQRARASLALGDLAAARDAVAAAERTLNASDDYRTDRIRADLLAVRGAIFAEDGQLDLAEARLSEALSAMGPERGPQRAMALLTRAMIRGRRAEHRGAVQDVDDALTLLAGRAAHETWQPLHLDDAPAAFEAVGELVASNPDLQSVKGLLLVERLRELLDGVPPSARLVTPDALARAMARLRPDQTLVYFLFRRGAGLLYWTVSNGAVAFGQRELSSDDVSRLVNRLTVLMTRTPDRENDFRPVLGELYESLLSSIPLDASGELVVIPDGILNRVPFGSLYDRRAGRFLFEQRPVRVAPDLLFASGLAARADVPDVPRRVLVVGEPKLEASIGREFERLPKARVEAAAVARLYPTATLLLGEDATKAHVLDVLGSGDVLHFAGHALAPPNAVESPRLLLTGPVADPASSLRASDLAGRRIRTPSKVVLAACETGAGLVDRARGVTSLAAVFLRAGTASVAGTLWPVDDVSSASFFLSLHRRLLAGDGMAEAVARAQIACRQDAVCRRAAATWVGTTAFGAD